MATISANLERLNNGNPTGCIATGLHRQVINSVGATRTLLAEESGSLCLFDRAAGVIYTLPAPIPGMEFEFLTTVTLTSNAYKVGTDAATTFLLGGVTISSTTATNVDQFAADGTSIVGISSNGSTTGGVVGGRYKVTALSSTQWAIEGLDVGTGTLATPFV